MAHDNREFDFVAGLRLLDRPTAGEPGGGEREREREKRKKEKERKTKGWMRTELNRQSGLVESVVSPAAREVVAVDGAAVVPTRSHHLGHLEPPRNVLRWGPRPPPTIPKTKSTRTTSVTGGGERRIACNCSGVCCVVRVVMLGGLF